MVEAVAQRMCSIDDPYRSCEQKPRRAICKGIRECKIAEKSERQLGYVLSSNTVNIFLKACPGSGKTEVVGLKAAYEFKAWKHKNCGIAILTFTNNAADVIEERVRHFAGIEKTAYPHFIGTIDSWLHRYVAHPFGHLMTGYKGRKDDNKNDRSVRLVEDTVFEGWICNYECRTGYCYLPNKNGNPLFMPRYANMLRYNEETDGWEIKIPDPKSNEYRSDIDCSNSEAFLSFRAKNPWLTLDYMRKGYADIKNKFLHDGFATYQDIEWICYRLLKERETFAQRLSQRFPFIIVDECQDLSWIQLAILGFLRQVGTRLHFVGDLHQAIYEFKKVEPKKVEDFVSRHNLERQELKENYRSCQQIVDLCQKLINSSPVKGKGTPLMEPACVYFTYKDKNEISRLPSLFEKYLHGKGFDVNKSAVLARGRSMVYQLKAIDRENIHKAQIQLATAIHLWKNRQPQSMDDSMRYFGHFITAKYFKKDHSNSRYYYCPESVISPMRWRLFLARILDECLKNDCGIKDLDKSWNSWAECVRNYFSDIVVSCLSVLQNVLKSDLSTFDKLDGKTFRVLTGSKNLPVIQSLNREKENPSRVRITTIHSVKGAEFDAVLLVSSLDQRGGKGGHWSEWRIDPESEHTRFAYVASSRPKYLLAWAIPSSDKNTDNINILKNLGFSFTDLPYDDNHGYKGAKASG
jgi:DNA helicase-2/ATP-dependent DNA helicase PcrA